MKKLFGLIVVLFLSYQVHSDCSAELTCPSRSCCKDRHLVVTGNTHRISDSQISASSVWGPGYEAPKARITSSQAWVPKTAATDPYLEFDLGRTWTILAIVTKGRNYTAYGTQFVKTYKVKYAVSTGHKNAGTWKYAFYRPAPEIASTSIFPGNHDIDSYQVNWLCDPIKAHYIRIYPIAHEIHKSLRADVIGCFCDE